MSRSDRAGARRALRESGDAPLLLLGVFFTFATMGVVGTMVPQNPGNAAYALAAGAVAGLIATAWAATFIFRKFWWLAIIVPCQMVLPWIIFYQLGRLGVTRLVPAEAAVAHRIGMATVVIACIAVGYVLVIRVTRGIERRTERYAAELEMAAEIHRVLVPPVSLEAPGVEVYGRSEASSEMGGDLLDVVAEPGRVDVFLADVSGHGVRAGLVMGMLKSAIRMRLRGDPALGGLLGDLNTVLGEVVTPGMFATFACVRLAGGGGAEVALAGHLPILHRRADGGVHELPNEHLPLGVDAGERFRSARVACARGDVFVLLTDGLVEVMNGAGRQLGLDPIKAELRESGGLPPRNIFEGIMGRVRAHGPVGDDQTLVVVRMT